MIEKLNSVITSIYANICWVYVNNIWIVMHEWEQSIL